MTMRIRHTLAIASLVGLLGSSFASAQWTERTVETVRTTQVQVLTSGPVHEAFAETVVNDPEPDLVVLQPPPEPLNEEPPNYVPDGPNMTWIPGYWAWDDDRDDYLWVSGIWRSVPPGRSYVPGFWTRVGHGHQWSSGFWIDADATEIEYLPEPPEPVEAGPPPHAPSPNLIWTPGTWVWQQDRYAWRPGHWVEASPDWMWIPAHYVWSPRGYVFVDGYWDYPIVTRGILFAPVYVSPQIRVTRFVYSPATVIDLDIFTEHLFVRPRYSHYYFGDYYAAGYIDKGFYPWHSVHARRVGYDPIYAHRRWRHRSEPDWERGIEISYNRRRDNERERPPRTFDLQVNLGGDRAKAAVAGFVVAKSLQQAMENQNRRHQFRQVDRSEREVIVQKAREATKSREDRKAVEARETTAGAEPVKRTAPVREKLAPPSISAKKDATTSKAPAPKKPDAPTVDRTVAPTAKQKVERVTRQPKTPGQPAAEPTRRPLPPTAQPTPRPAPKPDDTPEQKVRPVEPSKERNPEATRSKAPPPPDRSKAPDKDDEAKSKSKKKDKDDDE